jgi:hypothetical protein
MKKTGRFSVFALAFTASAFGAPAFGQAVGQAGAMAYAWPGLKDLDSNTVRLQDFYGKVILLSTSMASCGGCRANAPFIGAIAQKFAGKPFQGLGVFVYEASPASFRNFEALLKKSAPGLIYPLLHGIPAGDFYDGGKWKPYDAGRDVYFVIDHTGKIVHRIDGNQGSTMGEARYQELENAISEALNNIPTAIAPRPASESRDIPQARSGGVFGAGIFTAADGLRRDARGRRARVPHLVISPVTYTLP